MTTLRRVRPANAVARAASVPPLPAQPRRVTEEAGKGFVGTSVKDRAGVYYENHQEVEVLRATFTEADPAAFVRVGAGLTINLDNYESLRIDCAVTIPCRRDQLDEGYQIASDFVSDKINEEQTNWLGQAQVKKGKAG